VSLTRTWLTIGLAPPGIAAAFALLTLLGRLSGYRPFVREWNDLTPEQSRELCRRIDAACEPNGFHVVWRAPDDEPPGLVAVRNIEMETRNRLASGKQFPMRLSVLSTRTSGIDYDVTLKLGNRTVVLWDTG
jgi:hypothetical protein